MTDQSQPRRLTAIVALDMAGFSARMEKDEAISAAEVVGLRKTVMDIANGHEGRVFNTAGDGFMLEFGSSLTAVKAAIDLAEKCKPQVRVGVHLGDVQVQPNGDLLGHGVNVAARLMAQSVPGSVLISGAIHQTVHGPILERFVSRGVTKLEKMNETLEVFMLAIAGPEQRSRSEIHRRLAVILMVDMVGYTDRLEVDEMGTHELMLASRRQIVDPQLKSHGGRVINHVGDTTLAEFSSSVAAVNCALAIQAVAETAASAVEEAKRIHYRIGINLGEVIVEGNELNGEGIFVAMRLQALAPVGGIALSSAVRDQVEGKVPCTFEDGGEHTLTKARRHRVRAFLARANS